jgi:hypothetical protein
VNATLRLDTHQLLPRTIFDAVVPSARETLEIAKER